MLSPAGLMTMLFFWVHFANAALLQNFMMQQAAQAQSVGYGGGGYGGPGGHSRGRPGDWICPGCSNNNYAFRTQCHRCQIQKPGNMQGGFSQGGGGYSQGGGGYSQGGGGYSQGGGHQLVGGAPRRAGDWECPGCGNINFGFRVKCHKCQVGSASPKHPTQYLSKSKHALLSNLAVPVSLWCCLV